MSRANLIPEVQITAAPQSAAPQSAAPIRHSRKGGTGKVQSRPSPRLGFGNMLTLAALVGALVLGAGLPARAQIDGGDIAKLAVGALVVGAIVHHSKDDDRAAAPVQVQHRPGQRHDPWDRPHRGQNQRTLPAVCAIEIDAPPQLGRKTYRPGKASVHYGENCLREKGLRRVDLPQHCATSAKVFGRRDQLYTAECLRNAGYQLR